MINSKKSLFRRNTKEYKKDSIFEIIDIEEAITNSKTIEKCSADKFLYSKYIGKQERKQISMSHTLEDFSFETDNGKVIQFTELYDIIDILGNGTFGVVLSAYDKLNQYEKVAIKIIPKYKFKNLEAFIQKEVQIQSRANHPNLAKLYYSKENSNFIFLVMELLEGGNLKDFMIDRYNDSKDYLLLEEECAIIIKGILEGLNYLHSLNIIHRDIKPENIMLSRKGNLNSIKICDFGLATNLDDSDSKKCGTLIYMAPELIQKQFYNESIDSWACGFILYILCSGGMHPLYQKDHDEDSYQDCVKNVQGWEFPEKFPILARNLFLKLCKIEKQRRIEIYKALTHPWITRSAKSQIPLTIIEACMKKELIYKFKFLLSTLVFFHNFKTIFHNEFKTKKLKTPNDIETANNRKNTFSILKNPKSQRNKALLINSNNSKEKRKDDLNNKCFSPLPKNFSPININNLKERTRERELIKTSPRIRKNKTLKGTSTSDLKPSPRDPKMNDSESRVSDLKNISSLDNRDKKSLSYNNSQNNSSNTINRNKVVFEVSNYVSKKIFIKERDLEQKDIKINVSKNKSEARDKQCSDINLMKKSMQFPTNLKNDFKEKLDCFLERNVKKISSNEMFEKIKPKYQNSNSKERKTINLKKNLFINDQPKLSNVFVNVLKKGVKLKAQNEFIIPSKIRIVNENIYNENTDKNL